MKETDYGELHLPPEWNGINPINGQFLPGHTPANKGKKWSEYLSKRAQKRCAKGWANLDKYRSENGRKYGGRNRKAIICICITGQWTHFSEVQRAAEYLGIGHENISRCCRSNHSQRKNLKTGKINDEHQYMGYLFYYETDSHIWTQKINKPFKATTLSKYNNLQWLNAIAKTKQNYDTERV